MENKLLLTCLLYCLNLHGAYIPPKIYQHACQPQDNTYRYSSTPYISGDTFRNTAQFFVDELRMPINPDAVKNGDIIFVVTELLDYFFTELHPRIKSTYILLTHNSDLSAPGRYFYMLDDSKLVAWFAQNADYAHPKLFPIPIGIANRYWPHGNIDILNTLVPQLSYIKKNTLLYLNVAAQTNHAKRDMVVKMFANKPFCMTSAPNKPWHNYLLDLAQAKFVISPAGNGLDCHRTWESLLMGSIPIVLTSTLDNMYKDLPVLIVNRWEEVTAEFLKEKYLEMQSKTYNYEKIYARYWLSQIEECRKKYLNFQINSD